MVTNAAASGQAGYRELVRSNRNFRWLWIGNIVSLLGDWFNTIAIYNLVAEMTGSPLALAWVFITKMLPFAIVAPLAGLITDRFNRRKLMIIADSIRAVIVLGFLFVDGTDDLAMLYILSALQVALGAVFIPARSAVIPNITSARELLTANALMAATWSTLLAVGAGLGGFAAYLFGEDAVFLIDSASYVISAFCISQTSIPQSKLEALSVGIAAKARQTVSEIIAGWSYILHTPEIRRIVSAKASWTVAGSGLVFFITILGAQINPAASAAGIGILYSARGIGTGIGPIAARSLFRDESVWPAVIGSCVVLSGLSYLVLSQLPWTMATAAILILIAHTPSGANWVLSTVLLQKRSLDKYRGRLFSTEWLLLTVMDSVSILTAATLLENGWVDLRSGMMIFAALEMAAGSIWLAAVIPAERKAFREKAAQNSAVTDVLS